MRQRGRRDGNHTEIVAALKKCGMKAQDLANLGGGCPDILVGFRNFNVLLEIKDGSLKPSARELTAAEREWHYTWPGQVAVVGSPEEAIRAVLAAAGMGGERNV